jgi:hypothetical protein
MSNIVTKQEELVVRLGSDLMFPIDTMFRPVSGLNLLLQDIQLLLLTLPGERVGKPDFGCGIKQLLWDNLSTAGANGKAAITSALDLFEPRITLIDIFSESNTNTGLITFNIQFIVNNTDQRINLVFPLRVSTALSFA